MTDMTHKLWRVPWTEVRHGTEYEKSDIEHNEKWAYDLLDGCLDVWENVIADTSDDPWERCEQGIAIMDDVLIAFDMLGWKLVSKDDPESNRYPIMRSDNFAPDWCSK
jgi:hypothetical protein